MDNKKTMDVKVTHLPDEQVEAIINAVTEKTSKHIDEVLAKLDNKSVVVAKSDVRKALEELLAEEKKATETTKETAKETTPEEKKETKVEILDDEKKEEKFRIFSFGALKFLGAGFLGVGAGVAGKTVYDNLKATKAAKSEYIDASYDVSAPDYN